VRRGYLPLDPRERRSDAPVRAYFIERTKGPRLPANNLPAPPLDLTPASTSALPRSNQKGPGVRLIHGAFWSTRSPSKAAALLSVRPLEQEIQKKVASKNAKRQKQCS
jgi:hypothetical protein